MDTFLEFIYPFHMVMFDVSFSHKNSSLGKCQQDPS